MAERISDEELIEALREFSERVEGTPTFREMNDEGPYSGGTYKRRFGSWHDALRAADIEPTYGIDVDPDRDELVEELRTVADELGETPTKDDVKERGEYPVGAYDDEFGSFVSALEAAGLEPTHRQYNFSDVEPPEDKRGTKNVRTLRSEGPTPGSQLPTGTGVSDKRHGMWKFTINTGSGRGGGKDSPGGMVDPVYYLPEEHAPELVMRRFFDANPHVLENLTYHGLIQHVRSHKTEWADIAKDFLPDLMEEGADADRSVSNVVLVPVADDSTLGHCFEKSVASSLDPEVRDEFEHGAEYAWGFTDDRRALWESLTEGDVLLFAGEPGTCTHLFEVAGREKDWNATTDLWAEYEDGVRVRGPSEPWPYLVFADEVRSIAVPTSELGDYLAADVTEGQVQRFGEDELDPLRERFGSVDALVRDVTRRDDDAESPRPRLVESLKEPLDDDPPLTVADEDRTEQERERRRDAFRKAVVDVYEGCAFCGRAREAPDGSTELEAAHVYPKSEGGPDLVQNGLALCRLHHWAFDAGWFRVDENYRIHVRERPGRRGYEDFQQLDGERLYLPDEDHHRPHPKYLDAHREHVEFYE